jgi:hypothetical protein
MARWRGAGHDQNQLLPEGGRFIDAHRRRHLWDGRTDPTESDEEEMATAVSVQSSTRTHVYTGATSAAAATTAHVHVDV